MAQKDDEATASVTVTAPLRTYKFLDRAYPDASTPSEAIKQAISEVRMFRLMNGDANAYPSRDDTEGRFLPEFSPKHKSDD